MDRVAEWYRTLDLEPGASPEEVRDAWRDLAQVWHPDRFPNNERLRARAEQNLQRINEAYERLKGLPAAPRRSAAPAYHPPPEPEIRHPAPLEVLGQGVRAWNLWRSKYSNVLPDLRGAKLGKRAFEGIDLRECDLTGATLDRADLYKANLSQAKLEGARLIEADLNRALLHGTDLRGADLMGANLASADLRGADLRGAVLLEANLIGARFEAANLRGVIGADRERLRYCVIDTATRL